MKASRAVHRRVRSGSPGAFDDPCGLFDLDGRSRGVQWTGGSAAEPMAGAAVKKAVVVGGTLGIGLASARLLLEAGAEVVATGRDARNLETARRALGGRVHLARSDVASVADVDALGPLVEEKLGRVDLVLIHAGVSRLEPLDPVARAAHDGVFDVHTRGAFLAAQRLAPLVRDGGSIVFTTVTGDPAFPGRDVPSGSEAALAAIAEVLGTELASRRIRVRTVGPASLDAWSPRDAGPCETGRGASGTSGKDVAHVERRRSAEEIARDVLGLAFGAPPPSEYERTVDALFACLGVPPEPRDGARSRRSPE